jgi:hypothetical protein
VIAAVRRALRDALPGGDVITPDRAHLYPQFGGYPTPCAWVGRPTLRDTRGSTVASFPVAVVVDGAVEEQMAALDAEAARLWDALKRVRVDQWRAQVANATPEQFGPEGSTLLGLVFTVTVELAVATLCDPGISADPT